MRPLLVGSLVAFAQTATAQLRPELGASYLRLNDQRAEVMVGLNANVGSYLRAAIRAGGDVWSSADTAKSRFRVEYLMLFSLDPFAQQRWGVALGAGLGYRDRPHLVAVAEFEGRLRRGLRPALQVGLGAGLRAGMVLRRGRVGKR